MKGGRPLLLDVLGHGGVGPRQKLAGFGAKHLPVAGEDEDGPAL